MTNHQQALLILNQLLLRGVEHLVICPGGRNAPFLEILSQTHQPFTLHSHFDERSASFFALGLSQRMKAPVAVLTTSGTAVSETLSACVEAYYSHVPLVVLSSDRPRHFRGSAAPQTIEQKNLLKTYCPLSFDLEKENLRLNAWDQRAPLHINVCFDEPLVGRETDSSFEPLALPLPAPRHKESQESEEFEKAVKEFFSRVKRPLALISGSYGFDPTPVLEFLQTWRIPLYLEGPSGLKSHPQLRSREIYFPEILTAAKEVDGVIRVGHVPTHRLWRDLESSDLPVLNLTHTSFSGLPRAQKTYDLSFGKHPALKDLKHPDLREILERDAKKSEILEATLQKYPRSEPSLLRALQSRWDTDDMVYVGNSLPIREWDLVTRKNFSQVGASRGANGIDGQLSTFMGLSWKREKTLGIFGDLTSLYDLNAPWFLKRLPGKHHLAVLNNHGGMIFDRLFHSEIYLNRHEISFEGLSRLWGMSFTRFEPDQNPFGAESGLIEVRPDPTETQAFWKELS